MKKSIVLLAALSAPALAWPQGTGSRPDPSDPAVRVPPATYSSAFDKYRRLTDETVARWKATNDTVEQAGGWKAYLKEGRQPGNAASPEPAPAGQGK